MDMNFDQNQLNVLDSMSVSEGRRKQGLFFPEEEHVLMAVPMAEKYLAERYPDHIFVFTALPSLRFTSPLALYAVDENQVKVQIGVSWTKDDLSDITIKDDYFLNSKADEVYAYIDGVIASSGLKNCKKQVAFFNTSGQNYDPSKPLSDALAQGMVLSVTISMYISAEDVKDVDMEAVVKTWHDQQLSGDVLLWVMPEVPEGEPNDQWYPDYCLDNPAVERRTYQFF